jgi:ribosomal protein S17
MHTSGIILKLSGNKTIKVLIRKKAVHSLYKKVV